MLDRVDALLRRVLPGGDHGSSIIGDLRQELSARSRAGKRYSGAWYVRSAASLIVRYGPRRIRTWLLAPLQRANPREAWMANLFADLRFGVRVLLKTPQLSAVAILTIAIGVGLTTHTFSVVYGAILRGIPVPDDHQLVNVHANNPSRDVFDDYLSYPDFRAIQEQATAFSAVAGYDQRSINLAGDDAPPERYIGSRITWNLLDVVGVSPLVGRDFTEADARPDATLAVLLSHRLWQIRFGGDPAVVGSTVRVSSETATVVGVMPEGFRFPFDEDLWLAGRYDAALGRAEADYLGVVGRLLEGSTVESARAEVAGIGQRIAAEFAETNEGRVFEVQLFEENTMPAEIRAASWAMLVAVFGVLLIACVNVANLLLARATVRNKEMAVRTALGASRWRVTRQLLVEAAVLAFFGSLLGLALAYVGVDLFNRAIVDIEKPFWIEVRVDLPALVVTLLLTAVVALVAGIAPANRAAGVDVGEVLKDESRGSSGLHRSRFASALVMVELAVSCALLVGAGLMTKSVMNLRALDLGFEPEHVMTGRVSLYDGDYPTREDRADFFRRLQAAASTIPGVRGASLTSELPMDGQDRWPYAVEGETYLTDADVPQTWGTIAGEGFFEVMGARWVQGRRFTQADGDPNAEPVMIINRSFADRVFPAGDAIGSRIRVGRQDTANPWMRIVGVVEDLQAGGGVGGIGSDRLPTDQVYVPHGVFDEYTMFVAMRTVGPPSDALPALRSTVAELDANLPVFEVRDMATVIDQNTWAFGVFGGFFAVFGVVALFLAAVGLYGVMAFSVDQRSREIGVRMALGAEPGDILRMVLRRGATQLVMGLTVGLAMGWLLAKPLAVMLYGVNPLDPTVYGSIAVTLLAAGLLATSIPARAATRADPSSAMRA